MKLLESFEAPKNRWVVKKLSELDDDVLDEIIEKKQLDDDLSKSLGEAIESFKKTVPY